MYCVQHLELRRRPVREFLQRHGRPDVQRVHCREHVEYSCRRELGRPLHRMQYFNVLRRNLDHCLQRHC